VWRRLSYEPKILIGYSPTKFIYNGNIEAEFGKFPIEDDLEKVKRIITDYGWILMEDGDLESGFAVARLCLVDQSALVDVHAELRRLEMAKNELVSRQDFDSAARCRDQQDAIRNRIDSLAMSKFRAI
jgi:hypothetical protein